MRLLNITIWCTNKIHQIRLVVLEDGKDIFDSYVYNLIDLKALMEFTIKHYKIKRKHNCQLEIIENIFPIR